MAEETKEQLWSCGCHMVDGELVKECSVNENNKVCFRLQQEEAKPVNPQRFRVEAPGVPDGLGAGQQHAYEEVEAPVADEPSH